MIEEHMDPTAEAHAHISNLLRTLVTSAAGVAEKRAQRREAEQREVARQSEQARQTFDERVRAERQSAQLVYDRVHQDRWWTKATPEDIRGAVTAAGTWPRSDPRAASAMDRIGQELDDRHGIDLEEVGRHAAAGTAPSAVVEQVAAAQQKATVERAANQLGADKERGAWEAEVRQVAGDGMGAQIIGSNGWPQLQERLGQLDAAGVDAPGRLRDAVARRELASTKDKSSTLVWRLNTAGGHSAQASTRTARRRGPGPRPPGQQSGRPETAADRFSKKTVLDRNRGNGPESGIGQ